MTALRRGISRVRRHCHIFSGDEEVRLDLTRKPQKALNARIHLRIRTYDASTYIDKSSTFLRLGAWTDSNLKH